jgi:hypothetical protein
MHRTALLAALLLSLAQAVPAATYKWVDEKGVTHYGDTLPPDETKRGGTQIDSQGQIIKRYDAVLTPEQVKAREAEQARQKELDKQREEQQRRDLTLMNAYTNEQEIDLARDRNVQSIETTIRTAQERTKDNEATITDLQNQLEFFKGKDKGGKARTPPAHLVQELERIKSQQPALEAAIAELQKERQQVTVRYAREKQRFREIKEGGLSSGQTTIADGKPVRLAKILPITKASDQLIGECVDRWRDTQRMGYTAYAVSADLVQEFDHTDLVLDGRVRTMQGGFNAARFVCPLTDEGKVDLRATEIKKALASIGARY